MYHANPYPVLWAHKAVFKKKEESICHLVVLKKISRSQWVSSIFIQPKNNGIVRFLSKFIKLNQRMFRKLVLPPKIQYILLKTEGFMHLSSLELNMGYTHIQLSPRSKYLFTVVLQWGKYKYQKLPMGLFNSPFIFQEKISEIFKGFDMVREYKENVLVITKQYFIDHLKAI